MTPLQFKEARHSLGLNVRSLASLLSDKDEGGKRVNPRTVRRWEDPAGSGPPAPAVVAIRFLIKHLEVHLDENGRFDGLVNKDPNLLSNILRQGGT